MKKILLASENRDYLRRNSELLLCEDILPFNTTRGSDACRLHAEQHFNLILADFKLADMAGCTLCTHIRKTGDVPIILACQHTPKSLDQVEQSGASALLMKPINPQDLLETVGNFLDMQLIRYKREPLRTNVTIINNDAEFSGLSHNLSSSGLLFESGLHHILGSRIRCRFTLPGADCIDAEVEVVRRIRVSQDCFHYGVKFIALPPVCQKAIDSYVTTISIHGRPL